MDATYPAGPASVPADLTLPSPAYRRHAWLALAGLALFVTLYFMLSGWFAWTAYHLLYRVITTGAGGLWSFVAGACSALLAVFMLKALFFVKHGEASEDVEITSADQPRLFAFLHRLADEAGAPRPHRVYLSNRVNAAVFYEISIVNLIFPTRKNLEIGLALVNALSLGELKAVLAHEFGHFAQRTMYVGRWVYIGQQIAAHIIARRDALDRLLQFISRFDLRIAWVGWILSIVVWSIRSVMETVFRIVILAQRALSREMEFQADLVAVSLTGSDALVHALHRLSAADDAWSRAVQFAGSEIQQGRRVVDVFSLQTRIIEQLSRVLGQPDHGKVPPLPAENRSAHRVFEAQLAQPPRMWLTHPPSSEREDNCKRRYIEAAIDERSAWALFDDEPALRQRLSEHLFRPDKPVDSVPVGESLRRLDEAFDRPHLNRSYRGCYLGRPVARHAMQTAELYGEPPAPESLLHDLDSLYPESLGSDIERLRELEEERAILSALHSGALIAPNGIIRHRGKELKRSQLQGAIDEVAQEIQAVMDRVLGHHRRCRAAHLAAATSFGQGWPEYLEGLLRVLHYAEHAEANLLDARGYFGNVYAIVTADGKVSSNELDLLVTAGDALTIAIREIFEQRDAVKLDRTLARRLEVESWRERVEDLKLSAPNRENISGWLQIVDSWVDGYSGSLQNLKSAALEQLLLTEAQIGRFVRDGMRPADAPPPSEVPERFTLRAPGMERQRQTKLGWWDRFQAADGVLATVARLLVAAVIVGAVVAVGSRFGENIVAIHNGLARPVVVSIGARQATVAPLSHSIVQLPDRSSYRIEAHTADGELIESFDGEVATGTSRLVYNVASASPLVQWTAVYGGGGGDSMRSLGTPRWSASRADYVFETPPQTISGSGPSTREVLEAVPPSLLPPRIVSALDSEEERKTLIRTHAIWDPEGSRNLMYWLELAASDETFPQIIARRLAASPDNVVLLRAEQNAARGDDHRKVCEQHRARAEAAPSNGNLQYVAARCLDDADNGPRRMLELAEQFPRNGWIAMGVGFARIGREEWDEAYERFQQAVNSEPATAGMLAARLARLRRVTGNDDSAALGRLMQDGPELVTLVALETGELTQGFEPQGAQRAYANLANGNLDLAIQAAQADPKEYPRVLRLVAASDGAPESIVREALALPAEEGVDGATVWFALALAKREGADTKPFFKYIEQAPWFEHGPLLEFFRSVSSGPLDASMTQKLSEQTPEGRGIAYAMAAVLRGDSAPSEWRWLASKLLYAPERPYFQPTRAPARREWRPAEASRPDSGSATEEGKGKRVVKPRLLGF
jgi:Zn-dependent protease with chaperone function